MAVMATQPLVAVELGTTRTVVAVGEYQNNGLVLTAVGTYPTTGVRKGHVVSVEQAETGLVAALRQAEQSGNLTIAQVLLGVSGGHIQTVGNVGNIPIQSRDHVVTQDDVNEVTELAKSLNLDDSRTLLHAFSQTYSVDDMEGIFDPVGMTGGQLALHMLIVHGARARFDNAVTVFRNASVGVQDTVFGVCAASLAVLSAEQKKNGVLLIDLGGGTTDYAVFANDVIATAGSIGVGGDHITNDIALAFNITSVQAEELQRKEGSAKIDADASGRRLTLPQSTGFPARSFGVRALQTVINARMEETLCVVRARLDDEGMLPLLGAGVVLTGGGTQLRNICPVAQRLFGLPCQVGVLRNIACATTIDPTPDLATVAGLLLYGYEHGCDGDRIRPMRTRVKKIIEDIFKR
jgi:cell division protein FtsA